MKVKDTLINFTVSPSIVPANERSCVTIRGNSEYYRFYDDVPYTVTFCPKEFRDIEMDEDFSLVGCEYNTVSVYPTNGVISFEYEFIGEQEWEIIVCAGEKQREHLNKIRRAYKDYWTQTEMEDGINFRIYSLLPDLYGKKAFKCDMHMHSNFSDGKEDPEIVCANYRRYGYDCCALTDHHSFEASLRAVKRFGELKTNFTVFSGEEVHNNYAGRFHVVNFGGKYSVNDIILSGREKVKKQVIAESKKINGVSKKDAEELAWYKWITDEIRKSGGLSIFAHPYWSVHNAYNCPTNIAAEVFRRGYFDAYEVFGGCTHHEKNMQEALYNEMRCEGIKIPIVGSTDVHNSNNYGVSWCAVSGTVVFADTAENIAEEILNLRSAAIETGDENTDHVCGPFRLVKYTLFLLENYFPVHDRLCSASGTMTAQYFRGAENLKYAIEETEKNISDFEKCFFNM